jgi:S-adenosylmethionine uptake transporter
MPIKSFGIVAASLFFTLMALFSKMAIANFSATEIIFYRSLFGMLLLAALMARRGISFRTKYPVSHLKRCLAGTFCFFFEILALSHLPLSVSQTIQNTCPLFFTSFFILAALWHREKIDLLMVLFVIIGFLGVLFIANPTTQGIDAPGLLYGFMAAMLAASASWFIRDLGRQNEPNERTVFYFMLCGTLVGLIATPLTGTFHIPPLTDWYPILGVVISGLCAQLLWTFSWGAGAPLLNSVFEYSGIAFAAVLGVLVFNETLSVPMIIGMSTIAFAGIASSYYLIIRKK